MEYRFWTAPSLSLDALEAALTEVRYQLGRKRANPRSITVQSIVSGDDQNVWTVSCQPSSDSGPKLGSLA